MCLKWSYKHTDIQTVLLYGKQTWPPAVQIQIGSAMADVQFIILSKSNWHDMDESQLDNYPNQQSIVCFLHFLQIDMKTGFSNSL
jgi:hypothetical protein